MNFTLGRLLYRDLLWDISLDIGACCQAARLTAMILDGYQELLLRQKCFCSSVGSVAVAAKPSERIASQLKLNIRKKKQNTNTATGNPLFKLCNSSFSCAMLYYSYIYTVVSSRYIDATIDCDIQQSQHPCELYLPIYTHITYVSSSKNKKPFE